MNNSQKPRLLSKSRFKLALECPSKLFFTGKSEYANQSIDDPFLQALADGGFQVGELAKAYYPDGVEIKTRDYDVAVAETNELLKRDSVTIFEAALRFERFIVFVDILKKQGDLLELIEVKSKTYEPGATEFIGKKGGILAVWQPYLFDVAFQKHVAMLAFPSMKVAAYLSLVDKSVACPTDGLHQKFRIDVDKETKRRSAVRVAPLTDEESRTRILTEICVDDVCDIIFDSKEAPFADLALRFADAYERDEFVKTEISKICKTCEFHTTPEDEAKGLKSGRRECWKKQLGWTDAEIDTPTVIDVWDMRSHKKLIEAGKLRLNDLTDDDIQVKGDDLPGISRTERQWLQVSKIASGDATAFIDRDGLAAEMSTWKFPLHFIDFETATPAIPFNAGRRPYEEIAYQFSHHTVDSEGNVAHVGDYLNADVGQFPNFDFLRNLKKELETDNGTIFRYADHENSYLRAIRRQLMAADDVADREELCAFIDSITTWKVGKESVGGPRTMVDMRKLVLRYYYDPSMGGSNSIKKVLPAVLNSSEYLQAKYAGSNYGTAIPSRNYPEGKIWIVNEKGTIKDPYKLLEKLFAAEVFDELEEQEIKDGGAAMVAYARLQFEDLKDEERAEIRNGLLRYCELDTLAMVMIYEAWREMIR